MDWDTALANPDEALALFDQRKPTTGTSWDEAFANPERGLQALRGDTANEQFARERMASTPLPKWLTAGANEMGSDLWSTSLRMGMNSNPVTWAMGKIPLPDAPPEYQAEFQKATGLKYGKNFSELLSEKADNLNRYADAFERAAAETDKGAAGFAAKTARGVTRSLPPALLAGAAGGPYGAIGYGVATEANQAITEGKDAGLSGSKLAAYVTAQGAIEGTVGALMQKVGLGGMEKAFTKNAGQALKGGFKSALKEMGYRTLQEVPEELITEAGHAIASRAAGVTKETDWKALAMDTVAQTALTMGLVETPSLLRGRAVDQQWANRGKKPDVAAEMSRPETAQAWATANPEAAARMAAIDSPSRKEWEELTGEKMRGNPASRKAFADNVRAALAPTSSNIPQDQPNSLPERDPRWHYGKTPWKPEPSPESIADTVGTTPIANDPTPVTRQSDVLPVEQPVEQVTEFSTPKVDYSLKNPPVAPIATQDTAPQPTVSYLPPDLQNAGDAEFEALLKGLGGKPPTKLPKATYSARLKAEVEKLFAPPPGKVTFPPNMPEQRAPVATVTPESANALNQPVSDKTPQPAPRNPAQEAVVSEERRAAVLAAFRGQATKAVELPAAENHRGGYRVEFANGQFVDVLHKDTIEGDREGIRRSLVGQLGREPTEEEIATHGPSAAFVVRDDEGRELPGLGAMHIALDTPSATAYRHEALHMARRNNQISVAEWRLLKEKYAPGLNDAEAEERIANSAEAWSDPTIGDRVRVFFHKLLEALGLLDAKTVEALIKTGEVFNRKANRDSGSFALGRTSPKPSKVLAGEYQGEEKQPRMFSGMDTLPGQQDLFDDINKQPEEADSTVVENDTPREFPEGWTKAEFKKLREQIRDRKNEEVAEWNDALREVTGMYHKPNSLKNKVRGKFEKGTPGDETNIKGFDLALDFAKNNYPFLLSGKGSDASNLLAAITKGMRERFTNNSPEVWEEAWDFANRRGDASEGGLTSGSRDAFPDVPFQVRPKRAPFFSKLRRVAEEKVGGKIGLDQLKATLKNNGVTDEEIRDMKLDAAFSGGTITKDALIDYLDKNVVTVNVQKGGKGSTISGKFDEYTVPGGTNYQELLLTLPERPTRNSLYDAQNKMGNEMHRKYGDGWRLKATPAELAAYSKLGTDAELPGAKNYHSTHWNQPNVLAHVRMDDVTLDDGRKMLRIQEIQSDWHQDGKKQGYVGQTKWRTEGEKMVSDDAIIRPEMQGGSYPKWRLIWNKSQQGADYEYSALYGSKAEALAGYEKSRRTVPDAPFKDSWHQLAIKKALDYAVENGYDAVGLVKGADIAEAVGGPKEALSTFYDDILVNYLRKYAKKWGAGVRENSSTTKAIPSPARRALEFLASHHNTNVGQIMEDWGYSDPNDYVTLAESYGWADTPGWDSVEGKEYTNAHFQLDITPKMREAILSEGQPLYQVRGRPDLANPGTTPPVRKLVDKFDETYKPPYRSDAQDEAEVDKRLSEDYEGEKKRLLAFAPGSDYFDRTDVLAAKKIINREAASAIKRGDFDGIRQAVMLIDAYRRQGSEQAAAFRHRRDPIETPDQRVRRNLIEAVLTPPKKTQRKIDEALKDGNEALAQKHRDDWAKKFEEMKRKLKLLGVDLDNLNEYGYDPIRAAKAIGVVRAQKADLPDKAYEYWRNAILSGPKTQVANVIGTVGNAGWKFMVERPIEAAINSFVGRPEGAQIGEFQHLAAGILPGLSRAARNAMTSFQTEMPELERQLDRDGQFRIEEADVAIGGKLGRTIRMPQRLMLAADEFLKSFVATMDVGAQAYRQAKAEGLNGDRMRRRIEYLVNDLQSAAWSDAHDTALELSFQQKGSPTAKKLKEGLLKFRRIPGLRYVFPFVTTPVNIFEQGLRKAPITGDIGALKALYDNYQSGRPLLTNMTPRMAERVVAWGMTLALMSLIGGDDDEPFITGTVTTKDRGARDLSRRTYPPQSIRIGNRWFSYSRIEPFATTLALTVDWLNGLKSGDAEKIATTPFRSIFQQMKDKTFLDGVGDLMRIVDAPNTADEVANYGSSFVVSWVPNLVRATSRETGDQYQERSVWGSGSERRSRLLRRTIQRTELGLIEDRPAIDLWGREAKRGTSPVMGTDIPWRILSPADSRVPDLFVGDKVLLRWNAQNPGDEHYPAMPTKKIGDRDMTDEEYEQFLRISGGAARKMVERLRLNTEKPTKDDIAALEEAIDAARTRTRAAMKEGTPVTVEAVAGSMFDKEVQQRADIIVRSPPVKVADRDKWRQEKAEALQWLKSKGLTKDDVLKTYSPELRKIKTPKTRADKRSRLAAQLRGL